MTTIETHQIVIVRRPTGAAHAMCPACLKEVEMVSLEEAALLAGVGLRDICRQVGDDHIHLVETAEATLVCTNSLLNKISLGERGLNSDGPDILSLPAADPGATADQ